MSDRIANSLNQDDVYAADILRTFGLPDSERGLRIVAALQTVTDPEIPVVTVLDMGMIAGVRAHGFVVEVDLTPTFAGCPALDLIRGDIVKALRDAGEVSAVVHTVFDPPWTTERISDAGLRKLKEFGLAPPKRQHGGGRNPEMIALTLGGHTLDFAAETVACPFCNSLHTRQESMFGPTLCRAIHYCDNCRQSFEQFKVV